MALRVTHEEWKAFLAKTGAVSGVTSPTVTPKKSKYNNTKTYFDGFWFDSKGEAAHWGVLKLRQMAGEIEGLNRQIPFHLDVAGVHICILKVDYVYIEKGVLVVSDFKGMLTGEYSLKKSLLYALYGIEIKEVYKR